MREPSPATELRNLRREHNRLKELQEQTKKMALGAHVRAQNAEKERDEWKRRFDLLLEKFNSSASEAGK